MYKDTRSWNKIFGNWNNEKKTYEAHGEEYNRTTML